MNIPLKYHRSMIKLIFNVAICTFSIYSNPMFYYQKRINLFANS